MRFSAKQMEAYKQSVLKLKGARTGLVNSAQLWPGGVVYYTINPNLTDQGRVTDAINHWQGVTGIRFVQRTNQPDYVEFVPGNGCSSAVGRRGGQQTITLAPGCSTGNTIHEIGHALGLFHEHQRADRDNFVIVNINNSLNPAAAPVNYNRYPDLGFAGFEFGDLDFGSVMMYASFEPGGTQPVITRLDGSTFGVQRNGLSGGDIETINRMYFGPRVRPFYNVIESYTDPSGTQRITYDVYFQVFADDACTIPLSLPNQLPIQYRKHDRYGGINNNTLTIPGGTQSILVDRIYGACQYNSYGEVVGECYQEAITLIDALDYVPR
ncbi:hypothetical protein DYU11_07295 [Fibrisoma montanum]|uniref:Peptidase M12A domain-containing protein n=2 Tax=Fibrisoma montanum TaxID=2305895 RepID=A0A418MFS1_9BACT|nr:hypothetical protein DYU11_07295 [Fibrisoma montanum]